VSSLPDLLQQTREVRGEEVVYRFANGMTIKTEVLHKADTLRVLPLGTPQGALMNHLLSFPERVAGARVFEPFAGSGALGFAALRAGAAHVDFLDINPRALDFQRENAALNRFDATRFTPIRGDIAEFVPERRYDLILANPPFVPTPSGLAGTLTSNGGPEGNRFVDILLARLEELLEPGGRALIYVFQIVRDGRPLVIESLAETARRRPVEVTPSQRQPIPLETYRDAYARLFPKAEAEIDEWRAALVRSHGADLTLCHYVLDVGPRSASTAGCAIRENFAEKFGERFLVPSDDTRELAFGRVFENFVPGAG
jgi:SAM-dependent methyltransferase